MHGTITPHQYLNQYLEMLSDRFIKNAKPGFYADADGLYIQVYASGKRAFIHRTQVGGKQKKRVIGHYPAMSLAEARDELERITSGKNRPSLQLAFEDYYEHLCTQFRAPEQTLRLFNRDIIPTIGGEQLDTLTRADYVAVFKKVVKRGSPVMANRLLTQVRRFLKYCKDVGWIEHNPLADVSRDSIGGKELARDRTLSWDEITEFFSLVWGFKADAGTKWALYGCLLTGLRSTEVLNISDDGVTTTKMNRQHRVPLTPLVRAWLRLKPSAIPTHHTVPARALRVAGLTYTPHDLRRTFATRLADLGVALHVIEKMLDHRMTGVMAIYNRAEYWPDRCAAQRLWDRQLLKLRKKADKEEVAASTLP